MQATTSPGNWSRWCARCAVRSACTRARSSGCRRPTSRTTNCATRMASRSGPTSRAGTAAVRRGRGPAPPTRASARPSRGCRCPRPIVPATSPRRMPTPARCSTARAGSCVGAGTSRRWWAATSPLSMHPNRCWRSPARGMTCACWWCSTCRPPPRRGRYRPAWRRACSTATAWSPAQCTAANCNCRPTGCSSPTSTEEVAMAACSVGSSPVGSPAHALRRRALGVALALACIAAPVGATGSGATTRHAGESRMSPTAGLDTAACNADAFATTLQAAPDAPTDASAYWLDRGLLQWPGVAADDTGTSRLYHSATGGITAGPGAAVTGADGALALSPIGTPLPPTLAARFDFIGEGVRLSLAPDDVTRVPALLRGQLVLVREDADGRVLAATTLQHPGALDDLFAAATALDDLGATPGSDGTGFRVWAPTARDVSLCLYDDGDGAASARLPMQRDDATGAWSTRLPGDRSGDYYTYLVDVFVPGTGVVRNRVTDPYSVSLTADSKRSYVADLDAPALKPAGW